MKTLPHFVAAASPALLAFQSRLGDDERRIVVDYYGGKDRPPGLAKKEQWLPAPGHSEEAL